MRTYTFLFETKTRKWVEVVQANSMFEAATKAKQLSREQAKALATNIHFSFYHKKAV